MKRKQKQKRYLSRTALLPLAAALTLACSSQASAGPGYVFNTYPGIGSMSGLGSAAMGISADGKVVVGTDGDVVSSLFGDIPRHTGTSAFRWSGGTFTNLATPEEIYSAATATSGDGSVVVGYTIDALYDSVAFRCINGTMTYLGSLGGSQTFANGVSADGTVVVGASHINSSTNHSFRWTSETGMLDLGTLGGTASGAAAVSSDGTTVVGDSQMTGDVAYHAYRWRDGVMQDIGTLGGSDSSARATSAYGTTVVGGSLLLGNETRQAFRWTTAAGMTSLGTLGGANSEAMSVSANGSVVVGWSEYTTDNLNSLAFRWTPTVGMQKVTDWLIGAGVSVSSGWTLLSATGVNGNGNVVVGYGLNPTGGTEAWLARVGSEGNGLLSDIPAYNTSLLEIGSRAIQVGISLPNLSLFGAHHRSILDYNIVKGEHGVGAWTTGDVSGSNKNNTTSQLLEAGVSLDIGTARVGLGGGNAWSRQDMSGSAKFDGHYVLLEIANRFGGGVEASLLGYSGFFSTDLNRNYTNGASVDTSSASPDATSYAVRARLDWKDAAKLNRVSFSPYFAYTWLQTKLDGYTETGGGFPSVVNATKTDVSDLRYGFAAKTPIITDLELRVALEGVQRYESGTGTSGQVIGLWDFNLPGQSTNQSWARALVDLDYNVTKGMLVNISGNTATDGGDPTWGVSLGFRAAF